MKSILIITCLLFLFYYSKAQDTTGRPTCPSAFSCTANLVNAYYTDNEIDTLTYSYSKSTVSSNYHDVAYAGSDLCGKTTNTCTTNDASTLVYKVYFPKLSAYNYTTCPKLPVILLFHGGGFVDCNGYYNTGDMKLYCKEFAKRGYVAGSVE